MNHWSKRGWSTACVLPVCHNNYHTWQNNSQSICETNSSLRTIAFYSKHRHMVWMLRALLSFNANITPQTEGSFSVRTGNCCLGSALFNVFAHRQRKQSRLPRRMISLVAELGSLKCSSDHPKALAFRAEINHREPEGDHFSRMQHWIFFNRNYSIAYLAFSQIQELATSNNTFTNTQCWSNGRIET